MTTGGFRILDVTEVKILLALSSGPQRPADIFTSDHSVGHSVWNRRKQSLLGAGLMQSIITSRMGKTRVVRESKFWLTPRGKKISDLLQQISAELATNGISES